MNKTQEKQTLKGRLSYMHRKIKERSKYRGHDLPSFSREEFDSFMYENNYFDLWLNWRDSGFSKELVPSVDRLNDNAGYYFGNMQLITWEENNTKNKRSSNKGIAIPIFAYCLENNTLRLFKSSKDCDKALSLRSGNSYESAKNRARGKLAKRSGHHFFFESDIGQCKIVNSFIESVDFTDYIL